MAYTMLEERTKRHLNIGEIKGNMLNLKSAALRFLHEHCEGLRFSKKMTEKEQKEGSYSGRSLKEHQIPYHMQMDIDRLCLENAVRDFIESGTTEDAFNVYFCYLEMFVGDYGKSRQMIELLSEYESNSSSLLMKHRDHYAHSVYVFILGLAIYETSPKYRAAYQGFYEKNKEYLKIKEELNSAFDDEKALAHHFLQYWGLSSLFHDIGYPFELPFEQVAAYFEVHGDKRKNRPFVAYHSLENYIKLKEKTKHTLAKEVYDSEEAVFQTTDELFAYDIAIDKKLSKNYYTFTKESMKKTLQEKPTHPENFNHFMDHAYFSATILFKKLFEELECPITKSGIDAMTAIILHNSLYKFSVAFYKDKITDSFKAKLHPLAYLLMLCDELQCWDRTAYGRNSRAELHPMGCEFVFTENKIQATYLYDKAEEIKIEAFKKKYKSYKDNKEKGEEPKLKAYSGMYIKEDGLNISKFQADIEKIVELNTKNSILDLTVDMKLEERNTKNKNIYLSNSNFIHLYNFAVALNGRWSKIDEWNTAKEDKLEEDFLMQNREAFEKEFGMLSLEYKLSNINQAKAFAKYLDVIGCFYTDRPVAYEMLNGFTEKEAGIIGPIEHQRWLREHYKMGWVYTKDTNMKKDERELLRVHYDMVEDALVKEGEAITEILDDDNRFKEIAEANYKRLEKEEQDKDIEPLNAMLSLLKLYDGLRIYRYKVAE